MPAPQKGVLMLGSWFPVPTLSLIGWRRGERAAEARASLMPGVIEAIKDGCCRCTTDMWTDDNSKMNFVDITAHFSDKECTAPESHYLVMAKFPCAMEKSAKNIRNVIFS